MARGTGRYAAAIPSARVWGADLTDTTELLYSLAVLAEGGRPKDPARFVRLMADRLERTL